MRMHNSKKNYNSKRKNQEEDGFIDIKKYFIYYLLNWYWFLIVLVFSTMYAFMYLKYTNKVWRSKATILINEDSRNRQLGFDGIMEGFGLNPGLQNLENQLIILSSWNLVKSAISELSFNIDTYYVEKFNKKNTLYKKSPVHINVDKIDSALEGIEISLYFFGEKKFRIIAEQNEYFTLDREATWQETIQIGGTKISLEKTKFWPNRIKDLPLYFTFYTTETITRRYSNRLIVEPVKFESTIIELILEGTNPGMDRDFLNKISEIFIRNNLDKKNAEAERTIKFINNQLNSIEDSLFLTEDRLQDFRSRNRVMDISYQANQIIERAVEIEDNRAQLINEANYYDYLVKYLKNDSTNERVISPSTMGITDRLLSRLVDQLAELQAEYYKYGETENESPMTSTLLSQMRNTKKSLIETLGSIIDVNELALKENTNRQNELNRQASSLPKTERELLGFERQFNINDALYTLLLEKQAEAKIQKASNSADHEIIDIARKENNPVWPNNKLIYLAALFFGVLIPAGILLLFKELNLKILNDDDVKKMTSLPIIGHIPYVKSEQKKLVLADLNNVTAEAFRSLRSRLTFFTKNVKSPVILITSSIPGEGKSFTAINLVSIYSLTNKKTVIVGGDLRRPKKLLDLKLETRKGLSTWLVGLHTLDEIIFDSGKDNLWLIPAGPIPPNPSEILSPEKLIQLTSKLKERFDYIIIDSAPIGAVSDTFALAEISDVTILLVRINTSNKKILESTLDEINATGIKNIAVLINGISKNQQYYNYNYRHKTYQKYETSHH